VLDIGSPRGIDAEELLAVTDGSSFTSILALGRFTDAELDHVAASKPGRPWGLEWPSGEERAGLLRWPETRLS